MVNLRNLSVHRGWTSKSRQIYSKKYDFSCEKGNCPQNRIAYHDCKITAGVTISCYVKEKQVHFSIDGNEQFVSTCDKQELDFCYGFIRLKCDYNDSEVQVTLFPASNHEGTYSFVLLAIAN